MDVTTSSRRARSRGRSAAVRAMGSGDGHARGLARDAIERAKAARALAGAIESGERLGARASSAVRERALRGALDCGDVESATTIARSLVERHGRESARAVVLEAACARAGGAIDDAERTIEEALERAPGDQRLMRARVACALDRGDDLGAIERLCEYLDVYAADEEAWTRLGKLYLARGEYDKALFCYEEVVCALPFDPNAHRRIAEVLYTVGGRENWRDAKNYFAVALDFTNGQDVRALYGVVMCVRRLKETEDEAEATGIPVSEGVALADAAVERLLQRYALENESLLGVVRRTTLRRD